jgi:hypothetical protein
MQSITATGVKSGTALVLGTLLALGITCVAGFSVAEVRASGVSCCVSDAENWCDEQMPCPAGEPCDTSGVCAYEPCCLAP